MNPTVKGSFYLKPGVTLIPRETGGIVFRSKPLRALRINASAFDLVRRCEKGLSLDDECFRTSVPLKSPLSLFDRLCQAGLLEWKPPDEVFEPFVSIIVAVYNRADQIDSCIESLLGLDYPRSRYEIIVVDDASEDGTPEVVSQYDVNLVVLEQNGGQSAARNAGVAVAKGEIVAFVDSDCIAEAGWLRELLPYFQDSRNALVGGYVASFYQESFLDKYEEAKSPLNMGEDLLTGFGEESDFYVPTCNMLVNKEAYLRVGGLDKDLRVGEDVDFCWKLKEEGFRLVYVPKGRVRHKHRNRFVEVCKRRFDYGTSEPVLYARHAAIYKHYPWQSSCMAVFLLGALGLLLRQPLVAPIAALIFLRDVISKKRFYEKQIGIPIEFKAVLSATATRYYELLFHLTHHMVRYYVILMGLIVGLFPPVIPVVAALVLVPSINEFVRKKPRLFFPVFLFLFLVEQACYQTGVFWGCIKQGSFRTYRLVFVTSGQARPANILRRIKAIFTKTENSPVASR